MTITAEHAAELADLGGAGAVISLLRALTDELDLTPFDVRGLQLVDDDAAVTRFIDSFIEDLDFVANWATEAIAVLEELRP